MGRDERRVDIERADRRVHPLRELAAREIGVRNADTVGTRRVALWMIRQRHDAEAEAARLKHHRGARPLDIRPGPDDADAGRVEVRERVDERVRPEVERVIVGQRDAVDAEVDEDLRRPRRCAEVEDGTRHRLAARRDAAFEVEDGEVGTPDGLDDFRREQRLRTHRVQPLGHAPTEHRVAGERKLHGA